SIHGVRPVDVLVDYRYMIISVSSKDGHLTGMLNINASRSYFLMLKRTLLSAAVASALFAGVANAAGVVAIATSPTLEANSPGATEQY
ncbi:hypothetical protein ABTD55_21755, partial [Acinetobacter baumannii]